jgi:hypothetical protein
MALGDHIITSANLCTHHGIDVGDGTVVHWASTHEGVMELMGDPSVKWEAAICRTSHAEFSKGRPVWVREYDSCFDAATVVNRALSRVGERGYHLFDNNCEHFATWCKTGRSDSRQVDDATAVLLGFPVVVALGAGWLADQLCCEDEDPA